MLSGTAITLCDISYNYSIKFLSDKFIGPQPERLPNTAFDMAQDL